MCVTYKREHSEGHGVKMLHYIFFLHYAYYSILFFSPKVILEKGGEDRWDLTSVNTRGKTVSLQDDLDGGCGWTCITGNDTVPCNLFRGPFQNIHTVFCISTLGPQSVL